MNLTNILLFGEPIIGDGGGSDGGTSGVKVAVFNIGKSNTYEQIIVDEETVMYKISDDLPSTDELLGGFVCAMNDGDCGGIVIPLMYEYAEKHIKEGAVGVLDNMPIMLLVTSEMAAEIPGLSTGIYFYGITNRLIIYAALAWGL